MKAPFIAVYRCLSECIDSSLAKNKDRMRAENPVMLSCRYKNNTTAVVLGTGCPSGSHLDTWVSRMLWGL